MKDEKTAIFKQLKSSISSCVPPLAVRKDMASNYEVGGTKKVKVGKKEVEGMYFASVIIQKNFVGFYFFPIYTHPMSFKDIPEELKKSLKGKSCFHIKKMDQTLFKHIDKILKKGLKIYKKDGWV